MSTERNANGADRANYKPASTLFSSHASRSMALSLCNSLAEFERTSKAISGHVDKHHEALGQSLPKDVLVAPTQITDNGYAFYGTTVNHEAMVDYRGNAVGKFKAAVPVQMFFVTSAHEPPHWVARIGGQPFAKRDAGQLDARANRVEGASPQWLLSKRFFTSDVPGHESSVLALLKGLVDVSVSKQAKVLVKLEERIHAEQLFALAQAPLSGDSGDAPSLVRPAEFPEAKSMLSRFSLAEMAKMAKAAAAGAPGQNAGKAPGP